MFIHAKTLLSSAVKNFVSDLYGDIKKITGFMWAHQILRISGLRKTHCVELWG